MAIIALRYTIHTYLFYTKQFVSLNPLKGKVLVAQSCLTLRDPMDCKPARLLHPSLAKLLKGSGLPFPSPGDLPDQGIEPKCPLL